MRKEDPQDYLNRKEKLVFDAMNQEIEEYGSDEEPSLFNDVYSAVRKDGYGNRLSPLFEDRKHSDLERHESLGLTQNGELTDIGEALVESTIEIAEYLMREDSYEFGSDNGVITDPSGRYTLGAKPEDSLRSEDLQPYIEEVAEIYNTLTTNRSHERRWDAFRTLAENNWTNPTSIAEESGYSHSEITRITDIWEDLGLIMDKDICSLPHAKDPGYTEDREDGFKRFIGSGVILSDRGQKVFEELSSQRDIIMSEL